MQNFETSVAIRDVADTGASTRKRKIGVVVVGLVLLVAVGVVCGVYFGLATSKSSSNSYGRGAVLNATLRATLSTSSTLVRSSTTLPTSVDWRGNSHAVSPIKNQQQCGCCWAFSTSDAVEAAYGLATGTAIQLVSIQQIISCDTGNGDQGCNGGDPAQALSGYLSKTALTSANLYPFSDGTGTTSSCNTALVAKADSANSWFPVQVDSSNPVVYAVSPCRTSSCAYSSSSENSLMAALVNGPVSICVDASGWNNYAGGVVDGTGSDKGQTTCTGGSGAADSSAIDHAVAVVGYSTANSVNYWIVRNQWGTSWGEAGYIYLKRGQNTCCILCEAIQTTVKATTTAATTTATPTIAAKTTAASSSTTTTASSSSSSTTSTATTAAAAATTAKATTAVATTASSSSSNIAPACTNPVSVINTGTNYNYACYTSSLTDLESEYYAENYLCTGNTDYKGYYWCCWAPLTWAGSKLGISLTVSGTTTLYAKCSYDVAP